jgi:hypothetical protein
MAEKRSIPAALGIFIGPAIAYVSFLIFVTGFSEYTQIACFGLFFLTGHDLAKSNLSLSGILTILLLPAIPIAMYLNQATMLTTNHLSPTAIIALWAASVLMGAILAGLNPQPGGSAANVTRLAVVASGLLSLIVTTFIL